MEPRDHFLVRFGSGVQLENADFGVYSAATRPILADSQLIPPNAIIFLS